MASSSKLLLPQKASSYGKVRESISGRYNVSSLYFDVNYTSLKFMNNKVVLREPLSH